MVKGMLSLLQSCPKEVAHLRKELLIAARHILATDLRNSKLPNNYNYQKSETVFSTAGLLSNYFLVYYFDVTLNWLCRK